VATPVAPGPRAAIPISPENLALVRAAMVDVNISGTAREAFVGAGYKVAGKTGTAQVVGIAANQKYDEKRIAERHRDHALYIAFAPAEPGATPTIALAVLVENAGFGARAAAPIARQVLDYYLLGKEPTRPALPREGDDQPDADEMAQTEALREIDQAASASPDAAAAAATAPGPASGSGAPR